MPGPPTKTRERTALARAVRVLRARHDLSQEEVERRGGLGPRFVSRHETGQRRPTFERLVALADGLGVTFLELAHAYDAELNP